MEGLRPLLIRSPLLPGESILSYIIRHTDLNKFGSQVILETLCLGSSQDDRLDLPSKPETLNRMAELFRVDPVEIAHSTYHGLAKALVPERLKSTTELSDGQSVELLPASLATRHLFLYQLSQYCPLCLRECRYHRMLWSLPTVVMCVEHGTLLRTICPNCYKATTVVDTVRAVCSCGSALDHPVSDDITIGYHQETQSLVQNWLTCTPYSPTYYWPPTYDSRELYMLYDDIRLLIASVPDTYNLDKQLGLISTQTSTMLRANEILKQLSSKRRYALHVKTAQALSDWPRGFARFLSSYPCDFFNVSLLLSMYRKWEQSGIYIPGVRQWSQQHKPSSSASLSYPDLSSQPLSFNEVCDLLGISRRSVQQLHKAGYLNIDGEGGSSVPFLSVLALMGRIEESASVDDGVTTTSAFTSFGEVQSQFASHGFMVDEIIRCIFDGSLRVYIPVHRNGWRLLDLLFSKSDVAMRLSWLCRKHYP